MHVCVWPVRTLQYQLSSTSQLGHGTEALRFFQPSVALMGPIMHHQLQLAGLSPEAVGAHTHPQVKRYARKGYELP